MDSQAIESFLPLKPATFLVLLVLSVEDLHGYGIKKAIAERSEGRINMEPGTLYRLMARLVSQGLIEESGHRVSSEGDDERRRYYAITVLGRAVAAGEASRMVQLAGSSDVKNLAHEG